MMKTSNSTIKRTEEDSFFIVATRFTTDDASYNNSSADAKTSFRKHCLEMTRYKLEEFEKAYNDSSKDKPVAMDIISLVVILIAVFRKV